MSAISNPAVKKKKMQYDRANLQRAFDATTNGMSVYKAAKMYSLPESTLRDRTRGAVDMEATIGFETIFSLADEKKLVEHVTYMANIGYGYNKIGIQYLAKEFAESLGRNVKSESSLSNCWFYGFLKRWPDLKVVKPQKLSIARAQAASREKINSYYKELSTILTKNKIRDKPEHIFNIDETGINTEHSPPRIVCDKSTKPQAISSTRSATITIIAGGNALGNYLPPYYIFPGKRWNPEFLNGSLPGSSGEMSESGWSNTKIFNNYITTHFVKYANVAVGKDKAPTLLLYDGHRSHINLTLTEWAKNHNVVLFVLPPHTSHLTQPLDVGVFGPLKAMYNKECQLYMQRNPGINISKYQVAELTNKPYMRALSSENLISAFKKTGICPCNKNVIDESQLAPSFIYEVNMEVQDIDNGGMEEVEDIETVEHAPQNQDEHTVATDTAQDMEDQHISAVPIENLDTVHENENQTEKTTAFFEKKTIIKAVVKKPKRKFKPPFIAGSLLKKCNQEIMQTSESKMSAVNSTETSKLSKKATSNKKRSLQERKINKSVVSKPSTSGTSSKGGPINLISEDFDEDSVEDDVWDEDLCCVCGEWQPKELRGCISLVLTKWGQCDVCNHWTHLTYCSPVRVLRLHDEFRCPHCENSSS